VMIWPSENDRDLHRPRRSRSCGSRHRAIALLLHFFGAPITPCAFVGSGRTVAFGGLLPAPTASSAFRRLLPELRFHLLGGGAHVVWRWSSPGEAHRFEARCWLASASFAPLASVSAKRARARGRDEEATFLLKTSVRGFGHSLLPFVGRLNSAQRRTPGVSNRQTLRAPGEKSSSRVFLRTVGQHLGANSEGRRAAGARRAHRLPSMRYAVGVGVPC